MSAPRPKRQFAGASSDPAQRQITSYFTRKGSNDGASPDGASPEHPSAAAAAISPPLPANIQSNLLSVGMRVRKSVPEGYKTGSSYGTFSLWADADSSDQHTRSGDSFPTARPSRRELLPFCGIHKIGGLATQPESENWSLPASIFDLSASAADDDASASVPTLDDIPSLTSSQESAVSSASGGVPSISVVPPPPAAANRKRIFAEDNEAADEVPAPFARPLGLGVWRDRGEWLDSEVSPRSLTPAGWENARVMAVPRRRWKKELGTSSPACAGVASLPLAELGQENMAVDDFQEAEFLDYRYAGEMEVE